MAHINAQAAKVLNDLCSPYDHAEMSQAVTICRAVAVGLAREDIICACAQTAAILALLLRDVGKDARIVVGFLTHDTSKQQFMHAWVRCEPEDCNLDPSQLHLMINPPDAEYRDCARHLRLCQERIPGYSCAELANIQLAEQTMGYMRRCQADPAKYVETSPEFARTILGNLRANDVSEYILCGALPLLVRGHGTLWKEDGSPDLIFETPV